MVESFRPAPGILVHREGRSLRIEGRILAIGPEATAERAIAAQRGIREHWNRGFPDGSRVACEVEVPFGARRARWWRRHREATLVMRRMGGRPSFANRIHGFIVLDVEEPDAFSWVVAHELGHLIGLRDRYRESPLSRLRGMAGLRRRTPPHAGYEHSIMGRRGSPVTARTLRDHAAENDAPIGTRDDRVRLWTECASPERVAALSTAAKLEMLTTLLGSWWVSGDDVDAADAICRSAIGSHEAEEIRAGVARLLPGVLGPRHRRRLAGAMDDLSMP
ncbi:MAG: hypothetical protein AB7V42_11545 [Thermoleophilia bacterium]